MIALHGVWFPDGTERSTKWQYSLKHVAAVEGAIRRCRTKRTAIQAGGNIGLWPKRLSDVFQRVITCEPDAITRECLRANVNAPNVEVRAVALGAQDGRCGLARKGIGSHKVLPEGDLPMTTVDALDVTDCDLLQLDIEGYEYFALVGAQQTIAQSHPVIQVELREGHAQHFGQSVASIRSLLASYGYRDVGRQGGADYVFVWGQA